MTYERTELICYMLGTITGDRGFSETDSDALIELDQILNLMNQPSCTPKELEVIERMHEQMEIFNIQMGLNRVTQRKMGLHKHSKQ